MTTYLRVENAPPIDRPTLHITSARLALLWWRDVGITFTEPVELNELDDFTIAAVSRLGSLNPREFEEFTGLPPLVFNGLARRLHSLRLLEWRDDTLLPLGDGEPAELPRKAAKTHTDFVDLLYLPDTDDLLVVHDSLASWERAGLQPIGASPLPQRLHHATFRDFVATRISQGRVAGLPANAIALAEGEDEPLTAMVGASPEPPVPVCSVFRCAATIVFGEGGNRALLDVSENPRKKSRKGDTRVSVDISDAKGLIGRWAKPVDALAEKPSRVEKAMRSLGLTQAPWPSLARDGAGTWRLRIDGRQARTLSREALLTLPIGLEIGKPEFHVTMTLVVEPGDDEAHQLIRLDQVLQETLQLHGAGGGPIGKHHASIREVGGLPRLLSRAWQLRFYSLVYSMRESDDFEYV